MSVQLVEATIDDIDTIVHYLHLMNDEITQFEFEEGVTKEAVRIAFSDDSSTQWFIFKTDGGNDFGICYLDPVYNYWRLKYRYHLGGFYIDKDHRKTGAFKRIYQELKNWVIKNNGTQIFCFIQDNNPVSMNAFKSAGMKLADYGYYFHNFSEAME